MKHGYSALAIGEKNVNRDSEVQANKEYRDLLRQRSEKVMKRDEELQKRGLPQGLDGPDYYKDIDDWFDKKFNELKIKYAKDLLQGAENRIG